MVLLGGVGEFIILKWVGAKLVGAIGTHLAHSSAAAGTHFAMKSTNAALMSANAAATTGGVFGAVGSLCHSASVNRKLYDDVMKKRDALDVSAAVATDEEVAQVLLGVALGILAQMYYESLEHKTAYGTTKTELQEMECCRSTGCVCGDYDHLAGGKCGTCGHNNSMHFRVDKTALEGSDPEMLMWLWQGMAEKIYPTLKNRNGQGGCKDKLDQIDTCACSDCPCFDFDLCEENQFFSRRCSCGHRWREHSVTGSWGWIVMVLAQHVLTTIAEEE